ncbi:MAG: LysR family transcriptional regulator [Alphaproteobacteria bacterium]|nr:LysR family transcriptional regulator [Alphaproteobacteria bacterium]
MGRPSTLAGSIDLGDFRCLAAVATATSLASAARTLGINASTISRRLGHLEDSLGVTLLERGNFGTKLTDAGRVAVQYVHRALDDIDAIVRVSRLSGQGQKGAMRVGVRLPPVGNPLQPLLSLWREAFPEVSFSLFELNDRQLQTAITEGCLDAAFVTAHTVWPGAVTTPIYSETLFVALPANHRLCRSQDLSWSLLRSETFLTQEWDGSHSSREFFASLLGSGIEFSSHAASKQSVLALVGANFGVTLVTESQASVSIPGVAFRPIREANAHVSIELAWRGDAENPTAGRFVSFMRDNARSDAIQHLRQFL